MFSMYKWVRTDAIKTARNVDLHVFFLSKALDNVRQEGDILHVGSADSQDDIIVTKDRPGYRDANTGETGDSVKCLVRHLGFSIVDAIASLCEFAGIDPTAPADQDVPEGPPRLVGPNPAPGPYTRVFDYLTQQKHIPDWLVQKLIDWGQLYQEGDSGQNCIVIINPEHTFAEVYDPDTSSRQFLSSAPGQFWWFKPYGPFSYATQAYICNPPSTPYRCT